MSKVLYIITEEFHDYDDSNFKIYEIYHLEESDENMELMYQRAEALNEKINNSDNYRDKCISFWVYTQSELLTRPPRKL